MKRDLVNVKCDCCETCYELKNYKGKSWKNKVQKSYICRNCRAKKSIKEKMSISKEKQQAIVDLHYKGKSYYDIKKHLNISKSTIQKYLPNTAKKVKPPYIATTISNTEAAWLAGFIDGEGNIRIRRASGGKFNKKKFSLYISVSNANKESIENVIRIAGRGCMSLRKKSLENPNWSDSYVAHLYGNALKHIINNIKPYVIVKREHIKLCLQWYKLNNDTQKLQLKNELQLLSRNGFHKKKLESKEKTT